MPTIRIHERSTRHADERLMVDATLAIDGQEYPVTVQDPFSPEEEIRLAWYFEEHLKFPFLNQIKAGEAAASVRAYGERLFDQSFAPRQAYAKYLAIRQQGLETLTIEVVGSPVAQQLHWEALWDPDLSQPLAVQATLVRKNVQPRPVEAELRPSPTINILLVVARPYREYDVGYRTIARPLVETLRQADLRVQVDIVRPGTYEALVRALEEAKARHGSGYYHVVHLDLHGALLAHQQVAQAHAPSRHLYQAGYGRGDIPAYEGLQAFLAFEDVHAAQPDQVWAKHLVEMLQSYQVPIVILNACQSGKQVGESETSLGSQLMQAGQQLVLAMGYSVTVSAAVLMMRHVYAQLVATGDVVAAVRRARMELYNHKVRRAYFNQSVELEDWLLPVLYVDRPARLTTRELTTSESADYYAHQARRYVEPPTSYGFVGRDLDVLEVEKRLILTRNTLLVRGMGGAGKTTLLRHLAAWWQTTGWIDQVFYFGYDERGWTRQQILDKVGRTLLGEVTYLAQVQPKALGEQQALLAERLRARRHLLILDNLESITAAGLAIPNTLPKQEQQALRDLLRALAGGKTLVLLGSRAEEAWLASGTFEQNVYPLGGLDPDAASDLADMVLARHGATQHRDDPDLDRLLDLLDGFPLALQVVLANLAQKTPREVLDALSEGLALDDPEVQDKTESIVRCVEYSHSNLDAPAQTLLFCLAPFTKVIYLPLLDVYIERLKQEPALAGLPLDDLAQAVTQATEWGLLTPHEAKGFVQVQPVFPYFLRTRLRDQPDLRQAVERSYRDLYVRAGGEIQARLASKVPDERAVGRQLAALEFENLLHALDISLAVHLPFFDLFRVLATYIDATQQHAQGLVLAQRVQDRLAAIEIEAAELAVKQELIGLLGWTGNTWLKLKRHDKAAALLDRVRGVLEQDKAVDPQLRGQWLGVTYHQLGIVAQAQRQWAQAEQYYQQALAIYRDFKDRYSQASTLHQLGRVSEEQRQWAQALERFGEALRIYAEYHDEHNRAIALRSLARLWQQSQDAGVPKVVATILQISEEEAIALLKRIIDGEAD